MIGAPPLFVSSDEIDLSLFVFVNAVVHAE